MPALTFYIGVCYISYFGVTIRHPLYEKRLLLTYDWLYSAAIGLARVCIINSLGNNFCLDELGTGRTVYIS